MDDEVRKDDLEFKATREREEARVEFIPTLRNQLEMKGEAHSSSTNLWQGSSQM